MARGMLLEAQLPRYLWTYAVQAAAHIRNCMYHQRTETTPIFLLTGSPPKVSRLHVFGSVCFTYIQEKSKLDPRCRKGIFVGYDKNSPAYLVYHPDTKAVTRNHTVKFTERYPSKSEFKAEDDAADVPLLPNIEYGTGEDLTYVQNDDQNNNTALNQNDNDKDGNNLADIPPIPDVNQSRIPRQRNPPKRFGLDEYACQVDAVYKVSLGYVDQLYKATTFVPTLPR